MGEMHVYGISTVCLLLKLLYDVNKIVIILSFNSCLVKTYTRTSNCTYLFCCHYNSHDPLFNVVKQWSTPDANADVFDLH